MKVHAKGFVGQLFGFYDRRFHLLRWNGCAGQETETSGVAGAGHEARIGHPTHRSLDDRVLATK